MKRRSTLIVVLLLFASMNALGQEKFEREYRVSSEEIPVKARKFVQSLDPERKVKWYREESQQGTSIEAKTRSNGLKHSIEFDTNGVLLDVEILINTLPKRIEVFLRSELNSKFERSKIEKVQIQFRGTKEEVRTQIENFHSDVISEMVHYEVIVRTKTKKKSERYQYTINAQGKITEVLRIVERETDNLEY